MSQFQPVVNCNTNCGGSACVTGKRSSPTSSGVESLTTDAGRTVVRVMPGSSAEQQVYKDDPFSVRDGHYIGHDGFVVPKDFEEFDQRFPDYVAKWVSRHAHRSATKEDLEDWGNDLLLHLMHLPENSKHRETGKNDVVQTFDPVRQHGANAARFWNYINICLTNKFRTMQSGRVKDALCRPGNLSLGAQAEEEDFGSVGDEYCHSHSECLQEAANLAEKQARDTQRVQQFENFVWRNAPALLPVCRAIKVARNYIEAAALLGLTANEFNRMRNRLVRLRRNFVSGESLPKRRKPYKKRRQSTACKLLG